MAAAQVRSCGTSCSTPFSTRQPVFHRLRCIVSLRSCVPKPDRESTSSRSATSGTLCFSKPEIGSPFQRARPLDAQSGPASGLSISGRPTTALYLPSIDAAQRSQPSPGCHNCPAFRRSPLPKGVISASFKCLKLPAVSTLKAAGGHASPATSGHHLVSAT